jgi:putative phosphoribosyl transferase
MRRAPFHDRRDAGRQLAAALAHYADGLETLVLGLPRGGVVVAYEVAQALRLPLDVLPVRKLGVPGHRELAMGAIAVGGVRVLNLDIISFRAIRHNAVAAEAQKAALELQRQQHLYRGARPPPVIRDRTLLLVDDGIASGATMRAAVRAVRMQAPRRLVIAAPVAPLAMCRAFREEVDEVVSVITPDALGSVGSWYEELEPTPDEELSALLRHADERALRRCATVG